MKHSWIVVAACLAIGSVLAETKTLFKWVDEKGRTQYGDTPPDGFKGEVTRVQIDMNANTSVPPVRKDNAPQINPGGPISAPVPTDYLSQRRARVAKLEANVKAARERLEAARAALEKGLGDDEYMTVRGAGADNVRSRTTGSPVVNADNSDNKQNCREARDGRGRGTFVCPRRAPNPEGQAKAQALEDAVKQAEQDLEEAEAQLARERSG